MNNTALIRPVKELFIVIPYAGWIEFSALNSNGGCLHLRFRRRQNFERAKIRPLPGLKIRLVSITNYCGTKQ